MITCLYTDNCSLPNFLFFLFCNAALPLGFTTEAGDSTASSPFCFTATSGDAAAASGRPRELDAPPSCCGLGASGGLAGDAVARGEVPRGELRVNAPRPRPRPLPGGVLCGDEATPGGLFLGVVAARGAASVPAMREANIITCIHQDEGCDNCSHRTHAKQLNVLILDAWH